MANNNRIVGTYEAVSKNRTGVKVGERWYNISRYARPEDLEALNSIKRGDTVTLTLDNAGYVCGIGTASPASHSQSTSSGTAQNRTLPSQTLTQEQYVRLRAVEVAAQIVAQTARPDSRPTEESVAKSVLEIASYITDWILDG